MARHGAGTERIEAELREALDVPVFRLDADTAAAKDAVPDLLARFDAAPSGLLLGTQMVAKGHDFPDVTLGVVLDADSTLRFPDFRAEERTFALVAQLAGRAGRGPRGRPRARADDLARRARDRRRGAARRRRLPRRRARAPARAALPAVRRPDPGRLLAPTPPSPRAPPRRRSRRRSRRHGEATEILGPAPLFRLRGRERRQVVVKTTERGAAVRATGAAVEAAARDRGLRDVAFSVDVDPQ